MTFLIPPVWNATSLMSTPSVSAADVPIFLLIHTALSAVLVSSTWLVCYQSDRSGMLLRHPFVQRQTKRWLASSRTASRSVITTTSSSSYGPWKVWPTVKRWASSVLEKSNVDPTKLTTSFVEAKVGRLFLKPVTIPGRIWLSYKGTEALRRKRQKDQGDK